MGTGLDDSRAEGPPTPEQLEHWSRRTSAPENELPAGVGATVLLARTDEAAVGLTSVEAFSTGFRFTLTVRLRQLPPRLDCGGLFSLIELDVHPGAEIPLEDRLLLGIEYPDGRRASTLDDVDAQGPGAVADDERLVLFPHGGGGSDRAVDHTFWVVPLPPEGPVTFVVSWPGFGIVESRSTVDGALIRAAAAHSLTLWPPQPVEESPLSPLPRPASGWFAEPPDSPG